MGLFGAFRGVLGASVAMFAALIKAELDRRLVEAIAHPETSLPWDDVKRSLWPDLLF